ncbi:MAG: acetyl-CoA hydrolase/transferase C-terminal domain-containing protein [Acidimicrobiales bacterium]
MADGPDGPLPDPLEVARLAGIAGGPEVMLGWAVREPPWLEATPLVVTTVLTGPGTRAAVARGRVRPVPARLSALPGLLAGRLRPAVAVVGAHEDGGGWRLAHSPGFALAAARQAGAVVVERWPGPASPGSPELVGSVVGVLERSDAPDPPPANRIGGTHRRIGENVAGLVPPGATVQWGPGAIGASVVAALQSPVRVRSGLVTDELVALDERGLLLGTAETAYLWGGPALRRLAAEGRLLLRGVEVIHDLSAISAIEGFVAINTALQVGLDGAANVEVVDGRVVAGAGGHPDFAVGAARSPGGLSVVALASVDRAGRSTIVARPEVVSTPRSDVDVVVTEHGVADLRHASMAERAVRLIAVAAPEHREPLAAATPLSRRT